MVQNFHFWYPKLTFTVFSPIEIILEKNRAGARGTATLMFNKPTFKFSPMAPLYRDDMNAGPNGNVGW